MISCNNIRTELVHLLVVISLALACMSFTVVIDAGHGGHDTGAQGSKYKTNEKDLNLDVSLRLSQLLMDSLPSVQVILTRSTDIFLPLQERADIANKNHADLFICIHTNAADNRKAGGAEVYILGTDHMEDNLDVAMQENAVMKLESDQTVYQGFDPNSVESYILFELMQNQYMDRSLNFAELVQNEFVKSMNRTNRGVRQAAFWVLLKSACPSVLIEMGFISNTSEEAWLKSDAGKTDIVNGIFRAIQTYCKL